MRLLRIPVQDVEERRREIEEQRVDDPGWTADTIERILAQDPVVTIVRIDEHGHPWYDYELRTESGTIELHSLAVLDDDSWEYAEGCT